MYMTDFRISGRADYTQDHVCVRDHAVSGSQGASAVTVMGQVMRTASRLGAETRRGDEFAEGGRLPLRTPPVLHVREFALSQSP
jgi:hypothetical protein